MSHHLANPPQTLSPTARRIGEQIRNGTYLIDIDTLASIMVDGFDTMERVEVSTESRCRSRHRGSRE